MTRIDIQAELAVSGPTAPALVDRLDSVTAAYNAIPRFRPRLGEAFPPDYKQHRARAEELLAELHLLRAAVLGCVYDRENADQVAIATTYEAYQAATDPYYHTEDWD